MTKRSPWAKVKGGKKFKAFSGKVVVFMKKSTAGSSTDIPPHERSIKITYQGEMLWKKLRILM